MISPLLENINQSQEDYLKLIIYYKSFIEGGDFNYKQIAMIIDDVKCFWLERLKIIEYEIESLTENHLCFLLSGAIYLDVSEYEPYYFKSFGDYHLLFDPLLKLEGFFRITENNINTFQTIEYFKKVYFDTLNILTNYRNIFFILPIRETAIEDNAKHQELLKKIFYNIVSGLFRNDFSTEEDFCKKYSSYEEIEENINPNIKKHLVFNDRGESELSLRLKIENYVKNQMSFSALIKNKLEPQIFLLSIFSWFSQIVDILLICISLRLNPYIRFSITFHYLILIMNNFSEDKILRDMIERTIVFYIFTRAIKKERFNGIEFTEYYKRIKDNKMFSRIIAKIHECGINIFEGGRKRVESIILEEFANILQ